jgi:hypothetical protein
MSIELTNTPKALLDPKLNYKDYSVYGVKIGNESKLIPQDKIKGYNNRDWILCEDEAGFRIWERKVYLIKVPNGVMKALGINAQEDVEASFGKASNIEEGEIYRRYTFQDKGVKAHWALAENKLSGIVFGEL